MKMECDFLYGWIKTNGHKRKNLTKKKKKEKKVNPRDIAGITEEEESFSFLYWCKY